MLPSQLQNFVGRVEGAFSPLLDERIALLRHRRPDRVPAVLDNVAHVNDDGVGDHQVE